MRIERIDDTGVLKALIPEWEALWTQAPKATPFQHPAWLLPWWENFGSGHLLTFAAREGSRLVALAPLFVHEWAGKRQVTFMGNGVSDHLDFLCGDGISATPLLQALASERQRWDLCDLQDLSPGSGVLSAELPGDAAVEIRPQYVCSGIPLPDAWLSYSASLPHGLKRNLRRYRTQLDGIGRVTFETAGPMQFDEYLEALFRLHRARWTMKDDEGMLNGPAMERFHSSAAKGMWERGLVRFHGMRLDGALCAVVYLFLWREKAYSYLGGFEPAVARFSPGALILEYTLHQAILEGVNEFDFLRGVESYKADWGARPNTTSRLLLRHPS